MKRPQRRIISSIVLLIILAAWIWGAATIGSYLVTAPKWLSMVYFIVAGIGWVVPIRPVFRWMNSGEE